MILSYKTYFDKKKTQRTYFPEKILKGIRYSDFYVNLTKKTGLTIEDLFKKANYDFDTSCHLIYAKPKIHTIREDKTNFWKPGKLIHHAINSRSPNYFQFAPITPCKSVQSIHIEYTIPESTPLIHIDNRILSFEETGTLIKNDGFDNTLQFMKWFNKDFKGKIIHWSDIKY